MNYFWVFVISAFSIAIPAIISIVKRKAIPNSFYPLLVLIWIGFCNESISYVLIRSGKSNLLNSNVYTLLEFNLLLIFLRNQKSKVSKGLISMMIVGLFVWIMDNFILHTINSSNKIFRIFSSTMILWLLTDKITNLLLFRPGEKWKKINLTIFLSLFVYLTYRVFIHIFNLFFINLPTAFYTKLWLILSVINFITNLTISVALLWIPKQMDYTRR